MSSLPQHYFPFSRHGILKAFTNLPHHSTLCLRAWLHPPWNTLKAHACLAIVKQIIASASHGDWFARGFGSWARPQSLARVWRPPGMESVNGVPISRLLKQQRGWLWDPASEPSGLLGWDERWAAAQVKSSPLGLPHGAVLASGNCASVPGATQRRKRWWERGVGWQEACHLPGDFDSNPPQVSCRD